MRALRIILGTPVVLLAFVLSTIVTVVAIVTIVGIILLTEEGDGGRSFFDPAVALAELVYG